MADLKALSRPRPIDPRDDEPEDDGTREAATPSKADNRLTFFVPSEAATLSLGAASGVDKQRHIDDPGITARTDRHIHFQVMDPATVVSLGVGAGSVEIAEVNPDEAYNRAFNDAFGRRNWGGYAMVTSGSAWQESRSACDFVSLEGDVRMRASSATGVGDLYGGAAVAVRSASRASVTADSTKDAGAWATDTPVRDALAAAGDAINLANKGVWEQAANLVDALIAVIGGDMQAKSGQAAFQEAKLYEADWTACAKALRDLVTDQIEHDEARGRQVFHAADEIKVSGLGAAHIVAKVVASVGSGDRIVVSSGKSAGLVAGEVAGAYAGDALSIRSGDSLDASAAEHLLGRGKDGCDVVSSNGAVALTSLENASLISTDGAINIHGRTSAYAGAGPGAGFGLKSKSTEVALGKLSDANNLTSAAVDAQSVVRVENGKAQITTGTAFAKVEGAGLEIKAKQSFLKAKQREVKLSAPSPGRVLIEALENKNNLDQGNGGTLNWTIKKQLYDAYNNWIGEETRVQHVKLHERDDTSKYDHGIFGLGAVDLITEAWGRQIRLGTPHNWQSTNSYGNDVYEVDVPMGRVIGWEGGSNSSGYTVVPCEYIKIIYVREGGRRKLITGYPVR